MMFWAVLMALWSSFLSTVVQLVYHTHSLLSSGKKTPAVFWTVILAGDSEGKVCAEVSLLLPWC